LPAAVSVAPEPAAAVKLNRFVCLDGCRTYAAIGVVWLHSLRPEGLGVWEVLGRFGVPLFSASAAYLCVDSVLRSGPKPIGAYTAGRIKRLLVPFLAWSIIYVIARSIKPLLMGHGNRIDAGWHTLWSGTAHHLWFLPFIFVATLLLFVLACAVHKVPRAAGVVMLALSAAALAMPLGAVRNWWVAHGGREENIYTASLAGDTLAALLSGAAIAFLCAGKPLATLLGNQWRTIGLISLLSFAAVNVALLLTGRVGALENLAGMLLLTFALLPFDWRILRVLALGGPIAFGVYLAHILPVDLMRGILPPYVEKLGISTASGWWDITTFGVALIVSAAVCIVLRRIKPLAWLVG